MLLQAADRFFFASAAHVFKAPPAGATLHILGDSLNKRLRYEEAVGGTDAGSSDPANSRIDLAFIEVSPDEVTNLGGADAVQMDEVDVDESLRPSGRYLALGYPGSKTKVRYAEGALNVRPFAYHSGRADAGTYTALGFSPNTHLILDYDRAAVSWADKVERQGPRPHGMSGGGIWRVRNVDPAAPGPMDAKLVGILIHYYAAQHAIVSTRIALLLEGIRLRYPVLDGHLPKTRAVKLNVNRG